MPKLPVLSGHDVVKTLIEMGYSHVRTSGDHAILKKEAGSGKSVIPVPLHRELAIGTLKSIIRQTGLATEDFLKYVD